jgi:hypothetical protein
VLHNFLHLRRISSALTKAAASRCERTALRNASQHCSFNFEGRIGIGSRVNLPRRGTERTLPVTMRIGSSPDAAI